MFNLVKTFSVLASYTKLGYIFLKFLCFLVAILKVLVLFRAQICESDILQLNPGVCFFFYLIFLIIFIFLSNSLFSFFSFLERKKQNGTRGNNRRFLFLRLKYSYFLFLICFQFGLITLIPATLDSFNLSEGKTLENLWSFSEILFFEIFFLIILNIFSQFPLYFSFYFSLEEKIQELPLFWKYISFLSFLIAGMITPSLDPVIQTNLASLWIWFYIGVILFLQKRNTRKFAGFQNLF